jgi:hypothetical protein
LKKVVISNKVKGCQRDQEDAEKEIYVVDELFKRRPISVSELECWSHIRGVMAASIRDGKTARLHTINKFGNFFSAVRS